MCHPCLLLQGHVYIITNADDASNYKVVRAPVCQPRRQHWQEVVPHSPHLKVEDMDMFDAHAVLYCRHEGIARAMIVPLGDPSHLATVAMPEGTMELYPGANQVHNPVCWRLRSFAPACSGD